MTHNVKGLYKVRAGSKGDQIIHVPREASGWYSMEVKEDGTIIYKPVSLR